LSFFDTSTLSMLANHGMADVHPMSVLHTVRRSAAGVNHEGLRSRARKSNAAPVSNTHKQVEIQCQRLLFGKNLAAAPADTELTGSLPERSRSAPRLAAAGTPSASSPPPRGRAGRCARGISVAVDRAWAGGYGCHSSRASAHVDYFRMRRNSGAKPFLTVYTCQIA
jgi:hypothetical protein